MNLTNQYIELRHKLNQCYREATELDLDYDEKALMDKKIKKLRYGRVVISHLISAVKKRDYLSLNDGGISLELENSIKQGLSFLEGSSKSIV